MLMVVPSLECTTENGFIIINPHLMAVLFWSMMVKGVKVMKLLKKMLGLHMRPGIGVEIPKQMRFVLLSLHCQKILF